MGVEEDGGAAPPEELARETPMVRRSSTTGGNSSSSRKRRRKRARDQHKRLDIQGLRAVAVIAVVVNHLTDHPQGGFLGVDVFFVISGFLITSLMLREEAGKGRISLLNFYRRRIKRLFPASLTVTVVTVVLAYFLFPSGRFRSVFFDAVAATGFAANWRFLANDVNYFQSFGPISPLRHYWSLSVEEQFYVVWPITLIAAFAIARAAGLSRNAATLVTGGVAAGGLTTVSLVFAVRQTAANPVVSYFSTLDRGWELGIGAVLAIVVPFFRAPRAVITAMSWAGMALIGWSLFFVRQSQVPYPGALWPCLGAALVIAAVSGEVRAVNPVLSNPVAAYIGDISYSIYLVHFPVIVFATAVLGPLDGVQQAGVAAVALGLSIGLYTFIENPLRSRSWAVRTWGRRERRQRQPGELATSAAAVLALAGVTAGFAVFAMGKAQVSRTDQLEAQVAAALAAATASASGGSTPTVDGNHTGMPAEVIPTGPTVDALQASLSAALAATSWPHLEPPFDQPTFDQNHGCADGPLLPPDQCTWGNTAADAAHTLYLVGDSTSAALFGAFTTLIAAHPDWKMVFRSGAGCPFSATQINEGDANVHLEDCPSRNDGVVAEINQVHPAVMVFTSSRGLDKYIQGITPELQKVAGAVGKMVILPNGPHVTNPVDCATAVSKPADCISPVPDDYKQWLHAEYTMGQQWNAAFIDPTPWFCVDGFCPAFSGTTPIHKDDRHMTAEYSVAIAPAVDAQLTALGIWG